MIRFMLQPNVAPKDFVQMRILAAVIIKVRPVPVASDVMAVYVSVPKTGKYFVGMLV